ncbi:MAG: HAD hydrolase family protein [Lachnospiraceae bacterium]|nr:HAD hydrolase family protein [Lachnospiraceae bacterium]
MELCEKGIVMGNAVNKVKEKADWIIDSNDEDGTAERLKELSE